MRKLASYRKQKKRTCRIQKWRTRITGFIIIQVAGWRSFFAYFLPHSTLCTIVSWCCFVLFSADNVLCQLQLIFLTTNNTIVVPGIQTPPLSSMCIPFFNSIVQPIPASPFSSQTNNLTNYKTSTIHTRKIRIQCIMNSWKKKAFRRKYKRKEQQNTAQLAYIAYNYTKKRSK